MNNLTTIGRILFAIPFIVFGIMHLMKGSAMAGMVPSYVPGGVVWIYITGLAMVAAGVSIIIKKMIRTASLLLGVLLIIYILTIHLPGLGSADPMVQMMSMTSLLKDLGLAGAAFMISGLYSNE